MVYLITMSHPDQNDELGGAKMGMFGIDPTEEELTAFLMNYSLFVGQIYYQSYTPLLVGSSVRWIRKDAVKCLSQN